jgi:hypothetical protein
MITTQERAPPSLKEEGNVGFAVVFIRLTGSLDRLESGDFSMPFQPEPGVFMLSFKPPDKGFPAY